ncbi:unnamed protein product [Hermetia illucens]|uniref:peptidylprolyl isomerase n=1 Tax=Hermetia illucens TaxID=343691 RepID=A0A7R8UNU9_HERIL|nr:46 kDa FK506-binding nuclear protein [Hermetia illucens]CAD7084269.1 unnamed protein product [Hermetia illucens]
MFWGLSLKANKKYTQTISKPFHVSQAALDITNSSDEPVQVILTWDKSNYILCTLRKGKTEQVPLDLNFSEGDEISFTAQGGGNVHLAGYFMTDPDIMYEDSDSEQESADDLDLTDGKDLEESPKNNKKAKNAGQLKRKAEDKPIESSDEEDESADEEDDDDDDEDEEDEEDESESEEEEKQQPKKKQPKLDKSKENLVNGKAQQPKEKKVQNEKPKGGEKTLQGGVKIEDIQVGGGQEARPGKKVQVYYEGRLKSNNKVFDSSKQGAGFKFILGRGEVIKGWDIGVAGMKIGGKRRITCPPNMAYGARGSPPVIPPNSTLVFDVELKGVH